MSMGNPADASRYDPYGEMGHVKALPLAEAVEAYTQAVERMGSIGRITGYPGGSAAWKVELQKRTIVVSEAAYCVLLSGFAARTGENV